jgi:hypothetical protein
MFLIHGVYRFWPKRVAFRNDYCLRCQTPRRSIAIRTFDVGHIFWIPFLPVGFWKHWKCTVCGQDPHVHVKTRRSFKWAGLICLLFMSAAFWVAPVDSDPELMIIGWMLRVAAPLGAVLLFVHLLRTPKEPSLRQRLAAIEPASDAVCPFCGTPLIAGAGTRWSCTGCGALRY